MEEVLIRRGKQPIYNAAVGVVACQRSPPMWETNQ